MRLLLTATVSILALLPLAQAKAAGVLNIYNWGEYTNPELVRKFEKTYDVKVTLTDFDSNDTAIAKARQGGNEFDIVVPSSTFVKIWIDEGLLLESRPDQMENFKNIDPRWVNVDFDPGRHYTVPWQWGTTGVMVDKSVYPGDPNTSSIFLDPPPELIGKINVIPEMGDILSLAIYHEGGGACTADKDILRKVRDRLAAARDKWIALDYPSIEKYTSGDYAAGVSWGGAAMRVRLKSDRFVYGYPKEGYPIWMDNVAVLKTAPNVENAKLFQNFIMDPENAALISAYARYANGIKGSEKFMPEEMRNAPEIDVPEEFFAKGVFSPACPQAVNDLYTKIWTEVLK
ncbi:extracellular solute-binding protein [Shinella curvata]|uniref:Putrescine-binding periplasmic protein n=1 Tax=Shinella curvata TaxID=1817964 RepID=A0ABT8XB21_9HYPH|nr:extracellular solute-binding protein [Shinella curvata]MCJ8054971.1 extracellular solute-binding protein [Shinella curvata]MDO6120633.1 extracellular solute-binding protein [Shinella curvata]